MYFVCMAPFSPPPIFLFFHFPKATNFRRWFQFRRTGTESTRGHQLPQGVMKAHAGRRAASNAAVTSFPPRLRCAAVHVEGHAALKNKTGQESKEAKCAAVGNEFPLRQPGSSKQTAEKSKAHRIAQRRRHAPVSCTTTGYTKYSRS